MSFPSRTLTLSLSKLNNIIRDELPKSNLNSPSRSKLNNIITDELIDILDHNGLTLPKCDFVHSQVSTTPQVSTWRASFTWCITYYTYHSGL